MIGKYFSNGWKIFADFSNDWKKFSRVFQRLEKTFYRNEDSLKGSVPLISAKAEMRTIDFRTAKAI